MIQDLGTYPTLYNSGRSYSKKNSLQKYFMYFVALLGAVLFAYIAKKGKILNQELRIIVGLAGCAGILVLGLFSPRIPFYLFLAYVPFSQVMPGDFGGIMKALNLTNILLVITALGWIIATLRKKQKFWHSTSVGKILGVFIFLMFLSFLFGAVQFGEDYFKANIWGFKRWITPFLCFYYASNLIRDRESFKQALIIILLIVPTMAWLGLKGMGEVWHYSYAVRLRGSLGHSNTLAAFIVYYLFLHLGIALVNIKNVYYWLLFLVLFPGIKGLLYTFSRGGYIGFCVAASFIAFMYRKALAGVVIFIFLFLFFNQSFLPQAVQERLAGTFIEDPNVIYGEAEVLDTSSERRIKIWEGAFKMIAESPFLGLGFATFRYAIPYYTDVYARVDAHNAYLLMAAENGLPALLVYLFMLGYLFRVSYRIYKNSSDKLYQGVALGYMSSIVGTLVVNLFGSRMYGQELVTYFWVLAAFIMFIDEDLRRKTVTEEALDKNSKGECVSYLQMFNQRWGEGVY